jgi:hypothetical protein
MMLYEDLKSAPKYEPGHGLRIEFAQRQKKYLGLSSTGGRLVRFADEQRAQVSSVSLGGFLSN